MSLSRTAIGAGLGITIAVVWQVLGGEAVLWMLGLGAIGGLIGYVLDQPAMLRSFAERLER